MEAVFEQAIRIAQVEMLGQRQWTVLPQFEFGPGDHTNGTTLMDIQNPPTEAPQQQERPSAAGC